MWLISWNCSECSLEKKIPYHVRNRTVNKNNLASRELQHITTVYQKFLERVCQFKCWHLVIHFLKWWLLIVHCQGWTDQHITHLQQQCHNSKLVIFQERLLKVSKCYNFLWMQRWHNCSPAASFENCDTTLYLLKVHLQTFPSMPITQQWSILSCDTLVTTQRYIRRMR